MQQTLSNEQFLSVLIEARDWIMDAFPSWSEETVTDMTPSVVRRTVERNFEGGWDVFVAGTATLAPVHTVNRGSW